MCVTSRCCWCSIVQTIVGRFLTTWEWVVITTAQKLVWAITDTPQVLRSIYCPTLLPPTPSPAQPPSPLPISPALSLRPPDIFALSAVFFRSASFSRRMSARRAALGVAACFHPVQAPPPLPPPSLSFSSQSSLSFILTFRSIALRSPLNSLSAQHTPYRFPAHATTTAEPG